MQTLNDQVKQELTALKEIGVRVPKNAFKLAENDLQEYNNMKAQEIADLLIELS